MNNAEFEMYRQDYLRSWKPYPLRNNPHPALSRSPEEQPAILAAALRWRGDAADGSWDNLRLIGDLLSAGVSASDADITSWLDDRGAARDLSSSELLREFVQWVESKDKNSTMSVLLLTCVRKHFPVLSKKATDQSHRLLMQRLSVALKLSKDEVIPETSDAWTAMALKWRDSLPEAQRQKWEALFRAANSQHSTKPSKAYLEEGTRLASDLEMFPEMMRDILDSIGRDGPVVVKFRGYSSGRFDLINEDFTDLLRALIWLCVPHNQLTEHLLNAGERSLIKIKNFGPRSAKIATACAFVLSQQNNPVATHAISQLCTAAKHKSTRKGVAKAVTALEDRTGKEWIALEEDAAPTHGLTEAGELIEQIGEVSVRLAVNRKGEPAFVWSDRPGLAATKASAKLIREHPEYVSARTTQLREVKKTWRNQIRRLETMMCQGRWISGAVWQSHYLSHPIVGLLSRRLFWEAKNGLVGCPDVDTSGQSDRLTTIDGKPFAALDQEAVRLWHPAASSENQRHILEQQILRRRFVQPFQQAMREVHRADSDAANLYEDKRYAGDILHQGTFAALCRQRGWEYSFHGSPTQFAPSIDYLKQRIRATLWIKEEISPFATSGFSLVWLRIIGVRFFANGADALRLSEVPALIFSEVLRDVGLFVVASRAANATGWRSRIPESERKD